MSFIFTTISTTTPRKEKVADWAGSKKATTLGYLSFSSVSIVTTHHNTTTIKQQDDWKDVHINIKQMDQFYDATFYAWLKSEENVLVTSIYLHRIANEYPLERIVNALEWLTNDWRWESTSILVRHVTVDWCDDKSDLKRANLLRQLTNQWATHYTATLISTILMSSPYSTTNYSVKKRERFLREFTKNWDFSKLSEFFMFLRSRANIDYKFKCIMLQEAARRDVLMTNNKKSPLEEDVTIATPASSTTTSNHHRRTSSNDFQEMKRNLLAEEMEEGTTEYSNNRCYPPYNGSTTSTAASTSSSSSSSTTTSRYHHHHHARLSTSSSTLTMTVGSSSSTTQDNLIPSPSSSTSNNDKKRITVI